MLTLSLEFRGIIGFNFNSRMNPLRYFLRKCSLVPMHFKFPFTSTDKLVHRVSHSSIIWLVSKIVLRDSRAWLMTFHNCFRAAGSIPVVGSSVNESWIEMYAENSLVGYLYPRQRSLYFQSMLEQYSTCVWFHHCISWSPCVSALWSRTLLQGGLSRILFDNLDNRATWRWFALSRILSSLPIILWTIKGIDSDHVIRFQ